MRVRLYYLVSLLPAMLLGQTPAPEISTRVAPVTFRSDTNIVQVPVVVRDAKGRAVGNLTQDDFQLFDKGKPQTILKFSVEKPGLGAIPAIVATATDASGVQQPTAAQVRPLAAIPERFVAYIFDDEHIPPGDFLNVRAAADHHLAETMKDPVTRVGIFTISGHQALDFTDDREKAHRTLASIIPQSHGMNGERCEELGYYWADLVINQQDPDAIKAAIRKTMDCLHITDPTEAERIMHTGAMQTLALGSRASMQSLNVIDDVVRRIAAAPGSRRIVLVSSGFYLDLDLRWKEMDIFEHAIRSKVTISSLDARGLYTQTPFGKAENQGGGDIRVVIVEERLQKERDLLDTGVMAELADATGGQFFHNDNGLLEGFGQLAAQPEYMYVLGFSPQNMKMDGTRHALKVTLKNNKGLDIQARRDYYAPNHKADAAEQAKEDIQAAVFSRDELQEIPVDVSLQFFKSSDVNAKLTVVTKVDLKNLPFRKDEDRNDETLILVSSVFDRNGNFLSGTQRVIEMRLKDQTLDTLLAQGITVKTTHDLTSGSYLVRLVVRDSEGQTMAARNGAVEIP